MLSTGVSEGRYSFIERGGESLARARGLDRLDDVGADRVGVRVVVLLLLVREVLVLGGEDVVADRVLGEPAGVPPDAVVAEDVADVGAPVRVLLDQVGGAIDVALGVVRVQLSEELLHAEGLLGLGLLTLVDLLGPQDQLAGRALGQVPHAVDDSVLGEQRAHHRPPLGLLVEHGLEGVDVGLEVALVELADEVLERQGAVRGLLLGGLRRAARGALLAVAVAVLVALARLQLAVHGLDEDGLGGHDEVLTQLVVVGEGAEQVGVLEQGAELLEEVVGELSAVADVRDDHEDPLGGAELEGAVAVVVLSGHVKSPRRWCENASHLDLTNSG